MTYHVLHQRRRVGLVGGTARRERQRERERERARAKSVLTVKK
jgi:hypothetical protein